MTSPDSSTAPPPSPLATSFVRTFTPAIVALLVALLGRHFDIIDKGDLNGFVELALFAAFYGVPRFLEAKVDPRFGKLLGKAAAPKYIDQAGLEKMGEAAFVEKLNEAGPSSLITASPAFEAVPHVVNVYLHGGSEPDGSFADGYDFAVNGMATGDEGVLNDVKAKVPDEVPAADPPPASRAARVRRAQEAKPKQPRKRTP